ncbi:MAG: CotH kinase family protein [Lishizhenia sp.]
MNKVFYIFCFLFLVYACKKEIVDFNSSPTDNFELDALLEMNGEPCLFDAKRNTLKYSILESELVNFSPLISFKENAEVDFEETALLNNSVNVLGSLNLQTPYEIKLTYGGETKILSLIFTEAPLVQLVVLNEIVNGQKVRAKLSIYYPQKDKPSTTEYCGVEYRGYSSLKYDKKSFGLKVYQGENTIEPKLANFFNSVPSYTWVLNAMFVDKSKLRNKTAFEIWNEIPTNTKAASSEYVEVYLNNALQGVYTLTQKYSKESLNLGESALLYEGLDNSVYSDFNTFLNSTPISNTWGDWEQRIPDPAYQINWEDFRSLAQLIADGSEEDFISKVQSLIDLNKVVDYYLFVNLLVASDNVGKNWCFLKKNASSKFEILPWDLDGTFGRNPFGEKTPATDYLVSNSFFNRFISTNVGGFNQLLKMRWTELRATAFSNNTLFQLLNTNFHQLHKYKAIELENEIWDANLASHLEQFYTQNWLSDRLQYLDNLFAE